MPAHPDPTIDDAALRAVLARVPSQGWGGCGHPGGAGAAIADFSAWADRRMLEALAGYHLDEMRTRDRIALAVRLRLEAMEPHREALRRAIAWHALPGRQAGAAKLVWATADAVWSAAGDTSTDYNRYTKRGLLSGVLSATYLFWLGDETTDRQATLDFLERRLDGVIRVFGTIGRLKQLKPGSGRLLAMANEALRRASARSG